MVTSFSHVTQLPCTELATALEEVDSVPTGKLLWIDFVRLPSFFQQLYGTVGLLFVIRDEKLF